jgi:hypothetical protein
MKKILIAAALLCAVSAAAHADAGQWTPELIEVAKKDVSTCLDIVHKIQPEPSDYNKDLYTHFDAYFNMADYTVPDNALTNGEAVGPRFQFRKCLAGMGFSVK